MKEDKCNQIIKKRVFWTDYSVNIVLDKCNRQKITTGPNLSKE